MASGWESEGQGIDPKQQGLNPQHHMTTFDPRLPRKHQKYSQPLCAYSVWDT